jgi:hypothetical protein
MPKASPPVIAHYDTIESHRIRVQNVVGGAISVSTDQGRTWNIVGRVTAPATDSLMGYLASGYSQPGTVSATAIHGIRIRVGGLGSAYPKLINILPAEFAQTPELFGGHISGVSGIYTNIPAGTAIFRNLAPEAGDAVTVNYNGQEDEPLPTDYRPNIGDVFTIVATRPANALREVDIENVKDGAVTVVYQDGTQQNLCYVVKPVTGVGRFDGTSYTGVGAVNTNHGGVITVSTAPISSSPLFEGDGAERRGGFQIEPAYHNSQTDEVGAPMILVVGHKGQKRSVDQEGQPPLFHGYIDLDWDESDPDHSWIAQIKSKSGGDTWQPMRKLIGLQPLALADVTNIRLIHKLQNDNTWLQTKVSAQVAINQRRELLQVHAGQVLVQRGMYQAQAPANPAAAFGAIYVDGDLKNLSNSVPFYLNWDTSEVDDGEHLIEVRAEDANGVTVASNFKLMWIDNHKQVAQR